MGLTVTNLPQPYPMTVPLKKSELTLLGEGVQEMRCKSELNFIQRPRTQYHAVP